MSPKLCDRIPQSILFTSKLHSTYISAIIINGLCSLVAVAGNVIMILAILRNSSLRTPSFLLLCNLAISDLGVGLISQPLFVALIVAQVHGDVVLSCKLAIAFYSTAFCLTTLSLLVVTAISFDRFLAVYLGLIYRSVVTVKRVKVVIALLWLITILIGMTYFIDISLGDVLTMVIVVLAISLIFATLNYLAIVCKLYSRRAHFQMHTSVVNGTLNRCRSFKMGQYKKTLWSMIYVHVVFLLCYLPFLGYTIANKSIGHTSAIQVAYLITVTLGMINSTINPCLYYWRILELKKEARRMLGCGRLQ